MVGAYPPARAVKHPERPLGWACGMVRFLQSEDGRVEDAGGFSASAGPPSGGADWDKLYGIFSN